MNELRAHWWAETERDPTHLAAADWLVRLQNPRVSAEEILAWQNWMNQDARNAQAFTRIEAVSQLLPQVTPPSDVSARELARDTYDASVPIKEWREPPKRMRLFALAASIMLIVSALSAALFLGTAAWRPNASGYAVATSVGENRTVSLPDGSEITLGGDTRVTVELNEKIRRIELAQGEAYFSVAKDPSRPFKVLAGDATVIALGTAFNVRRGSDRAIVSVTEGRVLVEPVTGILPAVLLQELKPKLRPVPLAAGQQTMVGSSGIERATKLEDPSTATSWQSGQLTFRMEPLRYVLEDVNRYAPKPIILDDEALGSLEITGMVKRGNIAGWVQSLERTFGLRAIEEPGRIVLAVSGSEP